MQAKAIYYSVLAFLAFVGTFIAEALGGWDTALQTLVILMAIDYLTGLLCALIWKKSPKTQDGTFESKASIKGLIRKGGILLVVLIAARLDLLMGTTVTRLAVIMFFIANDGLSIIENLGIMGVPMPAVINNAFALLREKSEPAPSAASDAGQTTDDAYIIQGRANGKTAAMEPDVAQPPVCGPGDPEEDPEPEQEPELHPGDLPDLPYRPEMPGPIPVPEVPLKPADADRPAAETTGMNPKE